MAGLVIYRGIYELKTYIKHCPECLRNNVRRHRLYGTLQLIISLPIPCHTICIDFITGLPTSKEGFDVVACLIYKFTKRLGVVLGKSTWTSEEWALAVLAFL